MPLPRKDFENWEPSCDVGIDEFNAYVPIGKCGCLLKPNNGPRLTEFCTLTKYHVIVKAVWDLCMKKHTFKIKVVCDDCVNYIDVNGGKVVPKFMLSYFTFHKDKNKWCKTLSVLCLAGFVHQ